MITLTNHVTGLAGLTFREARGILEILQIFLPNIGEDQKKSYLLRARPLALCHMVNLPLVIALRL